MVRLWGTYKEAPCLCDHDIPLERQIGLEPDSSLTPAEILLQEQHNNNRTSFGFFFQLHSEIYNIQSIKYLTPRIQAFQKKNVDDA